MATIFQGSYLVSQHSSIPLQVQPQCFGAFATVSWAQCLYYGKGYTKLQALGCLLAFYCFFAGFETGSVFALWAGRDNGVEWPVQMYGWITSALFAIGLFPQYYEIWKHGEVLGISILFMMVDVSGGVFSGISLFFRSTFDSTAFVQYMLIVVLDGLVIVLYFVLNPIQRRRRAKAAALQDPEIVVGEQVQLRDTKYDRADTDASTLAPSAPDSPTGGRDDSKDKALASPIRVTEVGEEAERT